MTLINRLRAAEGWTPCESVMPDRDALVVFFDDVTGQERVDRARNLHRVTDVWWKLTGIARMEKGRAA